MKVRGIVDVILQKQGNTLAGASLLPLPKTMKTYVDEFIDFLGLEMYVSIRKTVGDGLVMVRRLLSS